jgi:hypothetical protein
LAGLCNQRDSSPASDGRGTKPTPNAMRCSRSSVSLVKKMLMRQIFNRQ